MSQNYKKCDLANNVTLKVVVVEVVVVVVVIVVEVVVVVVVVVLVFASQKVIFIGGLSVSRTNLNGVIEEATGK